MMNQLDAWLLQKHQQVANWTDVHYDKNCYWWGYVLTEVLCVCVPAALLLAYVHVVSREVYSLIGLTFTTAIYFLATLVELRQRVIRKANLHQKHPILTKSDTLFRKIYLWMFLIQFAFTLQPTIRDVVWLLILACWTSRCYFDACLPMPPHEKEKQQSELFDGVPEGA